MNVINTKHGFNWNCKHSWKKSAINTMWCLLGCSIGDNLTILGFQYYAPDTSMAFIMVSAMIMGLITSIGLEAMILFKQMPLKQAIQTAAGMSFISMLMMESSANLTNIVLMGGNRLMITWWSIIPSWILGFLSAWVYNYYKLKKYGTSCHA